METNTIARRYAQGIFSLIQSIGDSTVAQRNKVIERLTQIERNFRFVTGCFGDKKESFNFFSHPLVTLKEKTSLLQKAFKKSVEPEVLSFLEILVRKHRFYLLFRIRDEFHKLLQGYKGLLDVKVSSPVALTEKQKTTLIAKLQKLYGVKQIHLEESIDTSIWGGISLKIGSRMVEATLNNSLKQMAKRFGL